MAQPLPYNQPLLDVVKLNRLTVGELNNILADGADEVDRILPKLIEKHSTGSKIKAAQLALVKRELKVMQAALWGDLGRVTTTAATRAALKAAESSEGILLGYLAKQGVDIPSLRAAFVQQAKAGIDAVLGKTKNAIPLSRRVYKTQALSQGLVDRKVTQGLLLGNNAKQIAKDVSDLIDPNVKGGVAYAAHRLARTEINNAYKTSQETRYADDPTVLGMRWNLSGSHPTRDECNDYAEADDHDLGDGVYPVGQRPRSHPNCLCYLTAESVEEDEFIDNFLAGEYNTWIDEKAYTHAPKNQLLCP
jgi:hypothetical protein